MESDQRAFTRHWQLRRKRQAQRWAIRLDGGNLTVRERRRLKAWLELDENAIALRAAQRAWRSTNATQDTSPASAALRRWGRDTAAFATRRVSRFALSAAAAACVAVAIAAPALLTTVRADSRTAPGEQRLIVLDDGSRVLLNTDSAIDVQYTNDRRIVHLLSGEARFDVEPNPSAPFVVETSGGSVTALGTVFEVRKRPLARGGGAAVTGIEHRVRVEAAGVAAIVDSGEQTSWGFMSVPAAPTAAPHVHAPGWTEGILQFEDALLRDIVDELNRYARTRLVVIGDARELAVSGVFLTRDPISGLVALETSGRLKLTRLPGVLLVRKGSPADSPPAHRAP